MKIIKVTSCAGCPYTDVDEGGVYCNEILGYVTSSAMIGGHSESCLLEDAKSDERGPDVAVLRRLEALEGWIVDFEKGVLENFWSKAVHADEPPDSGD